MLEPGYPGVINFVSRLAFTVGGPSGRAPRAVNESIEPDKGVPAQHRPNNAELRPREYLTPDDVARLIKGARDGRGRHSRRDATLILIAYRHGLRAREICDLERSQVERGARPRCTSGGSRTASPRSTRCLATRSGPRASCTACSRTRLSSLRPSATGPSRRPP